MLPALLAKSSICYNPVIYASMNIRMSRTWKRFFGNARTTNKNGTAMTTINRREIKASRDDNIDN